LTSKSSEQWEVDRGPQELAYDFWWHIGQDVMVTSEWATPNMFENGVSLDDIVNQRFGHRLHFWDLRKRKHLQQVDLGAEHQMVLELRPAHNPAKAYGFVGVVVSTKDLSSSIWTWYQEEWRVEGQESHRNPSGARRRSRSPACPAALQSGTAAGHRYRPVAG
jgi:methanethiol oxidase